MLHSCTRTSLFYNTVLSVVRTINITKPFLQLKRSIIISSVILYPIIWVIVLIIDVHLLFPVAMTAVVVSMPGMGIASYLFKNATPGAIPYSFLIIFLVLPLVVPSVVCLAVIQICTILKPSIISPPTTRERSMTVTIIMLTIVCLVCNISYTASVFRLILKGLPGTLTQIMFIGYSLGTILPFLNAILNPLILLLRGAALRAFVVRIVRKVCNRRNVPTREDTELEVISKTDAQKDKPHN